MSGLFVDLRKALDRRWQRYRAWRIGVPVALALFCTGGAIFHWIEVLGARPQPSIVRNVHANARSITLVFDPGTLQMEVRPLDGLTPFLLAFGALPAEVLEPRPGDSVLLWISPFGRFTPVPRQAGSNRSPTNPTKRRCTGFAVNILGATVWASAR